MKISVYITSYNQQEYLKQAIDSVLGQTYPASEIVIIDDCSSDGSRALILDYQKQYPEVIVPHFNEKNLGITATRNVALSKVTGDYVTWLDGDDSYLPNKLKTQKEIVDTTGANLVYTNFYFAEASLDNRTGSWCADEKELPQAENIFPEVIGRLFPNGVLFRYELVSKELLQETGKYDENLEIYEDFDFRIRLCQKAKVAYSMEHSSVYRLHEEGLSRADKKVHRRCLQQIYSKYGDAVNALPEQRRNLVKARIKLMLGHFEDEKPKQKFQLRKLLGRIKRKVLRK